MAYELPAVWRVVGGADAGGILVRTGPGLSSSAEEERLATGAMVQERALAGERMCYQLLEGSGPSRGWVSVRTKDKDLLVRTELESPEMDASPLIMEASWLVSPPVKQLQTLFRCHHLAKQLPKLFTRLLIELRARMRAKRRPRAKCRLRLLKRAAALAMCMSRRDSQAWRHRCVALRASLLASSKSFQTYMQITPHCGKVTHHCAAVYMAAVSSSLTNSGLFLHRRGGPPGWLRASAQFSWSWMMNT